VQYVFWKKESDTKYVAMRSTVSVVATTFAYELMFQALAYFQQILFHTMGFYFR